MTGDRGKLITVEGGEGVGKSTNMAVIKSFLDDLGIEYVQTREPGGTRLAEQIRMLLLGKHQETMDSMAELLLIFAARAQHLKALITPALEAGTWVLCDRFTDATYAYQGAGRKLDWQLIARLETMVQGELRPDLTLILDLDPATGLQRASQRGGELDRFESEGLAFLQAVRAAYLQIAKADPERCAVINTAADAVEVRQCLLQTLQYRLGNQL